MRSPLYREAPDNIFLITDGLPTQGDAPPRKNHDLGTRSPGIIPRRGQAAAAGRAGQYYSRTHGG